MKRTWSALVVVVLVGASCGGTTSSSSCAEYAAEVREMIDSGASADALSSFVTDTEEHVARLMADDPDSAGPCVEAVFEAMFTGAFEDLDFPGDE
jgi:hypothetical protein